MVLEVQGHHAGLIQLLEKQDGSPDRAIRMPGVFGQTFRTNIQELKHASGTHCLSHDMAHHGRAGSNRSLLWPARFNRAVPYLMLLPAIVLVGLLVLGLIQIADTSLRTLDTSTFLMSDYYTLANYKRALTESLFATVAWRSLFGSLVVTAFTLLLAFPMPISWCARHRLHCANSC